MQCPSCRAVYSNGLDLCPRCKTPASKTAPDSTVQGAPASTEVETGFQADEGHTEAISGQAAEAGRKASASTLIEFPGVAQRPQWRKELSERVREIQERRAREAEREAAEAAQRLAEQPAVSPQLGLVPPIETPVVNPIVQAALKRIQRAHQPPAMPRAHVGRSGNAATAVARVAREQDEEDLRPSVAPVPVAVPRQEVAAQRQEQPQTAEAAPLSEREAEPPREHNLVVVQTQPVLKTGSASQPLARRVFAEAIDDSTASRLENSRLEKELAVSVDAAEELYDDRAPLLKRLAGALIDLVVVAFAASPFAAIIELTNGNWADPRVLASMGGIVVIVMFLYLTASTALAGRTWGMSLVSVRAVDADTGNFPTTWQCVRRALFYMLSLATFGSGLLYALLDAEGRTVHDKLSGTAVVKE